MSTLYLRSDQVVIKKQGGTAELILENATSGVNGYLYNTGGGVTEFRAVAPGAAAWGAISGTLSAQADLVAALALRQPLDADLTAIAGLSPSNNDIIQRKLGAWTNRSISQYKTDLALDAVENVSISTWGGSGNITMLGTIASGLWNGAPIPTSRGGVPAGGFLGQVLKKVSDTDYDYSWQADSGGGGGPTYTFTTNDFNEVGSTISIDYTNGQAASGSVKGFLTAADWTTFNNKQNAISTGTTAQYIRGDLSLATFPAVGTTETASEGLTKFTTDIQLGGSITGNKIITTALNKITIQGATTGNNPVFIGESTSSGIGILGLSSSGAGITGTSGSGAGGTFRSTSGIALTAVSDATYAAVFSTSGASTNSALPVLQLHAQSAGTAANGFGIALQMFAETSDASLQEVTSFYSQWIDATTATRFSILDIRGYANSTATVPMSIWGDGYIRLNEYDAAKSKGTPAFGLAVNTDGDIITVALGGGGGGGAATGEGVIIDTGLAYIGNDDNSTMGELTASRYVPGGNSTIWFKGNGTNGGAPNIAFIDDQTATIGSPKTKTWMQFNPLMASDGNVPFYITQSVTESDASRGNEVWNMGWNLSPGGGLVTADQHAIGMSIEQYFQGLTEMHDFYVSPAGDQYRLASYTINTVDQDIDFYNTVSRHYYKVPATGAVYLHIEPGAIAMAGTNPVIVLNNADGTRVHTFSSMGTNNEMVFSGGGFRIVDQNISGMNLTIENAAGGALAISNGTAIDYFLKQSTANGSALDLINGTTTKKAISIYNASGNTAIGRGTGTQGDNTYVLQVYAQNNTNYAMISAVTNISGGGPGTSTIPLTVGSSFTTKSAFNLRYLSNDPGDGSGSDNTMLQINPYSTSLYTSFAASGYNGMGMGASEVPQYHLHVRGATSAEITAQHRTGDYFSDVKAINDDGAAMAITRQYGTTAAGTLFGLAAANLSLFFSNSHLAIGTYGATDMVIGTANTARIKISSAGAIQTPDFVSGYLQVDASGNWSIGSGGGSGSTTINNNANNRIITGSGTADVLEGEASFLYNAGVADITAAASPTFRLHSTGHNNLLGTTQTFGLYGSVSSGVGAVMEGWSGASDRPGFRMQSFVNGTTITEGAFVWEAYKSDGAGGVAALAAGEELFSIFNGSNFFATPIFAVNGGGQITVNNAYTLPATMGSAGQVLAVPASGTVLEWITP